LPATQIDRPFRIKTTLGEDALLLNSFTGSERVSTPFRFLLELLSPDPNVDMQSLLRKSAVISVKLDDEAERHIHGLFSRIALTECGEDGMAVYQAELVPWFWFLTLYSNCRIFQNKSVPDIVEKIFADRGCADYKLTLKGTYQPRDYCVQYRETDFNFVSRLLEEEGIFYYFQQSEDKHTLVLADDKSAFESCPHKAKAKYMPTQGGRLDEDTVVGIEEEHKFITGMTSLADYDFEKPNTSLYATISGSGDIATFESYDYPGDYKTKDDGDRYARLRMEEREVQYVTVRGKSNCMGFECGYKFTLSDHFRDAANQDYTLIALDHKGRNTSYRSGHTDPFDYSNQFEAIPNSVPFRPPRLAPKPVIPSTQTAVVVGKSGEEIWTDQYGRIKVQFYWDREGTRDEKSSCWIRVAQTWAGKSWGAIFIPRIGQEVVVSFLEGDPDRPLITGSLYNADQTVPYALPDFQTKSTIKSNSTKGSAGFNEIRLDDTKGSEDIFIHAEKNLDIRVKNDEYKNVLNNLSLNVTKDVYEKYGNDHHLEVVNNEMIKIDVDHNLKVGGKQAIQVTGSHTLQVTGDVIEVFSGNHSEKTSMNLYIDAGIGIVIEGTSGITLKCGSNSVVIDPSGVTVTGSLVVVDGQLTRINSGPGSPAMSGTPGNAVSPAAPKAPTDADDADPGTMAQIQAQQMQQQTGKYGAISPAAFHPPTPSAAGAASAAGPTAETKKTWFEVKLLDTEGKPVAGEAYKVTLPDGSVSEGTLDDKGMARVEGIDPGSCQVTFPNMDKSVWKPK
jgi:type VI secretion system secreted protein VgrG